MLSGFIPGQVFLFLSPLKCNPEGAVYLSDIRALQTPSANPVHLGQWQRNPRLDFVPSLEWVVRPPLAGSHGNSLTNTLQACQPRVGDQPGEEGDAGIPFWSGVARGLQASGNGAGCILLKKRRRTQSNCSPAGHGRLWLSTGEVASHVSLESGRRQGRFVL